MKKKICFLCPKAYALFNDKVRGMFGGSEASLSLLGKGMSARGDFDVSFIVADYGQKEMETLPPGRYFSGKGSSVPIKIIRSFKTGDGLISKVILFIRAMNRSEAEVFVQRAITPFSGMIALYCRMTSRKFIYMLASDYEVDGRYEKSTRKWISFLANLVFRFSHIVIVQSMKQETILRNKGVRDVHMLKSGVTFEGSGTEQDGSILWVGRSIPSKDPHLFLELAFRKPERKLVMISSGSPDGKAFHETLKETAGRIPNLEFIENAPFEEVNDYYKKANVLVSTSSMEGFPLVFVQAAANKTPILSLMIDPDGFIRKEKCGYCCRGNFYMLEEKIDELFLNEKLHSEMSENALKYAKKNHDLFLITEQFSKLLEKA